MVFCDCRCCKLLMHYYSFDFRLTGGWAIHQIFINIYMYIGPANSEDRGARSFILMRTHPLHLQMLLVRLEHRFFNSGALCCLHCGIISAPPQPLFPFFPIPAVFISLFFAFFSVLGASVSGVATDKETLRSCYHFCIVR